MSLDIILLTAEILGDLPGQTIWETDFATLAGQILVELTHKDQLEHYIPMS